jgi:hypothetical protein
MKVLSSSPSTAKKKIDIHIKVEEISIRTDVFQSFSIEYNIAASLSYIAFIMMKNIHSVLSIFSAFIMKGC